MIVNFDFLYFMDFLYFPEDRSEYIPAFITLVIFMIGAVGAMVFFHKKSKAEEEYFDEKYKNTDFSYDDSEKEKFQEKKENDQ